jgi:hypothetical protein
LIAGFKTFCAILELQFFSSQKWQWHLISKVWGLNWIIYQQSATCPGFFTKKIVYLLCISHKIKYGLWSVTIFTNLDHQHCWTLLSISLSRDTKKYYWVSKAIHFSKRFFSSYFGKNGGKCRAKIFLCKMLYFQT